jgi:hypothetical protein
VKLQPAREDYFDEKQLYYQWLHTRSAFPLKLTRYFSNFLWAIAAIFVFFYDSFSSMSYFYLPVILSFLLAVFPLIMTFIYFLYFMPKAIHDDSQTGLLDFIHATPVPTGDLVSGLRKYFILLNIKILIPPMIGFGVMFMKESSFQYFSGQDWTMTLLIIMCVICFYWFIVESGILAAAMPRIATISGATLLLWVLPVLIAIGWGGYKIAAFGWDYYMRGIDRYSYSNPGAFSYSTYSLVQSVWFTVHYIVFLLVFTLYLFFNSRMFMDFRRRGRWR